MNPRTDELNPEPDSPSSSGERNFRPALIELLVVLTFITIFTLATGSLMEMAHSSGNNDSFYTYLSPGEAAANWTVAKSIAAFSQLPFSPPSRTIHMYEVTGLIAGLVLGPILLLVAFRRHAVPGHVWTGLDFTTLILGALLTAYTLIPGAVEAYRVRMLWSYMRAGQSSASLRDLMVDESGRLGFAAEQYYSIPKSLGGGGHSFAGFNLPLNGLSCKYFIKGASADTICITSVASEGRYVETTVFSNFQMSTKSYGF